MIAMHAGAGLLGLVIGCAGAPDAPQQAILSDGATPRPTFEFDDADAALLDEVQRGAFAYFWEACDPATGMVRDRSAKEVISIAGVGFQLAALPIGVERGWVERDAAEARALRVLGALRGNPSNRKDGLFYHFLAPGDAGPAVDAYEHVVSTIDSALFFAGAAVASSYFGGEVEAISESLFAEADWASFAGTGEGDPNARGFINLAWKPDSIERPTGDGSFTPYFWMDAADEQRLVTFMAVAAPGAGHAIPPETYYRLRRRLGVHDGEVMVWLPWSGAMFTAVMSHCFIDYALMGPDDPAAFGVDHRARVDWWENSRRIVNMHRAKAIENPLGLPTLSEHAWGLNASDVEGGYAVPGLFPDPIDQPGMPEVDYPTHDPEDAWGDGTIAPYSPGSAIMFEPAAALDAMRYLKSLRGPDGSPLAWRDPSSGGFGFVDACHEGRGWATEECLAIDQGQLLLAIENARTGLVWDLFRDDPRMRRGFEALGLARLRAP